MNTPFSLVLGMTYTYLPFMILPLYSNLAKMDLRLLEAAADLGATPWMAFWRITVPLSRAGIIAGSMLVFIPCVGEYVIPELLGGPQTQMIGRTLWDEFFSNNDWPMACAVAVTMVLLVDRAAGACSAATRPRRERSRAAEHARRRAHQSQRSRRAWLALGYAFLYLPIVALVVYSFNDSPVANVWRGFTLRVVRGARRRPRAPRRPVRCRSRSRFSTACASVVLGTLAAFALVKLPALLRQHAVRRHGQRAAGDARGDPSACRCC